MAEYRLDHETLIRRIEYLAIAERGRFERAESNEEAVRFAHSSTILDRLLDEARARKIVVPQIR